MKHLPLYVFNTDPYPKTPQKQFKRGRIENIGTVISLSSGFKRYKMHQLYKPTKVVVYDLNPYSLKFHKSIDELPLLTFSSLKELYYEYHYNDINICLSDYKLPQLVELDVETQLKSCWTIECERWGSETQFINAFHHFKEVEKVYIECDITRDISKIEEQLTTTNFMHISNIFSWTHNPTFTRDQLEVKKEIFQEWTENPAGDSRKIVGWTYD